MKYAIIETNGHQYKVSEGNSIQIDKIDAEAGKDIQFTRVLFGSDEGKVHTGAPILENAKVIGQIVRNFKSKKTLVFKKKRRKGYSKKHGHRSLLTEVKIKEIAFS